METTLTESKTNKPKKAAKLVRASSMPLIQQCGQVAYKGEFSVNNADDSAALGTAFHELIAIHIEGGFVHPDRIEKTAESYRVDPEELTILWHCGVSMWSQIYGDYPKVVAETDTLSGYLSDTIAITGHIDLVSTATGQIRFGDWKTGWKTDRDYWPQMAAYAAICFDLFPHIDVAHGSILWVRKQERDGFEFTRDQITEWKARIASHINQADYSTGDHCAWCHKKFECIAYSNALVQYRTTIGQRNELFGTIDVTDVADRSELLIELWQRASHMAKICEEIIRFVKGHVEDAGAIYHDNKSLSFSDQSRDEISGAALIYLENKFGTSFLEAAKVSKTAIKDMIYAQSVRGMKGKVFEATMKELEDKGLVGKTTFKKLELKTV